MEIFFEIGLLMLFAGIGTYLAKLTKQPLIPAYIVSGIIIGNFFGIIDNKDMISNLSEIGIAFLLFMVGLEMEFKKIRSIGAVSSLVGTIQVSAVFFAGYIVAKMIGFASIESVYLGVVIAFSSTMIVVKILSDNRETSTLHGRMAIGILIVQDIFAICALSYLAAVSSISVNYQFFMSIIVVGLLGAVMSKFVFPHIFYFAAKSRELILTLSLSVCFLFSLVFYSLGLSITIGAFFAGVLLANLPYNLEIAGKIRPLRDFFSIIFFTSLGLQLDLYGISGILVPLGVLLLLVLVFKPLVIMLTLLALRYQPRTAFLTSVSLAQISEFSIIIMLQGVNSGILPESMLTMAIVLAIATMTFTSYFMSFETALYGVFTRVLKKARINLANPDVQEKDRRACDVVLCGYDRIGYSILNALLAQKKSVVVVDFDPDAIRKLSSLEVPCVYGDMCDQEVLGSVNVKDAGMFISTANAYNDNLLLLKKVREINPYLSVIVTAHKIDEALELYKEGADYVILPHFLGGDMVGKLISDFETNQLNMRLVRYNHMTDLVARKGVGHDHPTHLTA